jgi:hypothetical protein
MYSSRFLQRAWFRIPKYFSKAPKYFVDKKERELDTTLSTLIEESMGASFAVNLSNWGYGIIVGIYSHGYSLLPEWKKFGEVKIDSRPMVVPESHIIASIEVAPEELLTHTSNLVRSTTLLRLKMVSGD